MEETTVETVVETVDLTPLVNLLTEQNTILKAQYTATLFIIGVCAAVGVSLVLYHFIKSFY